MRGKVKVKLNNALRAGRESTKDSEREIMRNNSRHQDKECEREREGERERERKGELQRLEEERDLQEGCKMKAVATN